jgi:hypothetical protein
MTETGQIIVGIIFVIIIFILTRIGIGYRIRQTATYIIKDLERQEAFNPDSAVELPYAEPQYFRIGMRDFKPKALQSLIQGEIVGKIGDRRYYIKNRVTI